MSGGFISVKHRFTIVGYKLFWLRCVHSVAVLT